MRLICVAAVGICAVATAAVAVAGEGFLIIDAINQAVQTNPGVGEAAANRRATETELRQNQSTLLPQVRVGARAGREWWDFRNTGRTPQGIDTLPGNHAWHNSNDATVFIRQLVFDGFASINEI